MKYKIQILEFINKTLSIYITVIYYDIFLYPDIIRLIIEQFVAVLFPSDNFNFHISIHLISS